MSMVSPYNLPKHVFPPCSKRIHFAICGLPGKGSVIGSRRHFLIVAATSAPAIMHCIMGRHGQCMSWRDDAGSTANIVDRAAPSKGGGLRSGRSRESAHALSGRRRFPCIGDETASSEE